jgi:predicted component of type VI protein secretion system
MTDLVQQLEQMRLRLHQQAEQESNLLAELGDAMRATDHQLLQDVRTVTADHEARRATILNELQLLASRLNAFPVRGQGAPSLPNATRGILANGVQANGQSLPADADWEQRSAIIREALHTHLAKRSLAP